MDDTDARARKDENVTSWALDDPRWHSYSLGWRAGYLACQRDAADRLSPADVDRLVVERFAALLADLRTRADGIF